MKKFWLIGFLLAMACQQKDTPTGEVKPKSVPDTVKVGDTTQIGGARDTYGCLTSAGYTFSALKNDCIRVFEVATRFDPIQTDQSAVMSAFVIFDEPSNRAELFVVDEKKPVMLVRKAEGEPYVSGNWELIAWKGYVIRYKGEPRYSAK